jgi:hypothetical protein
MARRFQLAQFAIPGGWAAACGTCDDRIVVFQVGEQLIAVVAEGSSPTYGGYYAPLGLDLVVETFSARLRDHRHTCSLECVRAVGKAASAALYALQCEHRAAMRGKGIEASAAAGGVLAARRGLSAGDRLVNCCASITALVLSPLSGVFAHIGMGRIYRARSGVLDLIADDHSLASVMRRAGETLDPVHDSVVTRLLGLEEDAKPDVGELTARSGDRIMVCSDGVWRLGDDVVARALAATTVDESAEHLTKAIGTSPGDDASAVIIAVS